MTIPRARSALLATALILGACGDGDQDAGADGADTDAAAAAEDPDLAELAEQAEEVLDGDPDESVDAVSGHSLPETLPEALLIPDDHVIVRNDSGEYDDVGVSIGLNIAVDGTEDEWAEAYDESLRASFDDVERDEDADSQFWRFSGHGFETATVYVGENQGYLDQGDVDTTDLPVMLTIMMSERRAAQ